MTWLKMVLPSPIERVGMYKPTTTTEKYVREDLKILRDPTTGWTLLIDEPNLIVATLEWEPVFDGSRRGVHIIYVRKEK